MKVFGPEKVYYGDTVSLTCVSEPALPGTFHLVTFHFPSNSASNLAWTIENGVEINSTEVRNKLTRATIPGHGSDC